MDRLVKYGLILLALGLVLGMALVLPGLFIRGIIEPGAIMLWALWRVISSVDQGVYWAGLIILSLALIVRALPPRNSSPMNSAYLQHYKSRSPVERWKQLFDEAASGKDEDEALRTSLKNLLEATIQQSQQSAAATIDEKLASEGLSLPPAAHEYVFPSSSEKKRQAAHRRTGAWRWAPHWLRQWSQNGTDPDSRAIDELLSWMESILEIEHDG